MEEMEKTTVAKKCCNGSVISIGWLVAGVLAIIMIVIFGILATKSTLSLPGGALIWSSKISADDADTQATAYINDTLLAGQATAELSDFVIENGLYKFKVSLAGNEFDSYMTLDGSVLYPEGMPMKDDSATNVNDNTNTDQASATTEIPKQDDVTAYLFTMAFCPYGNQAEEAMIPAVGLLGDKANVEPHYVIYDNYNGGGSDYCLDAENKYCSMHGIQELNQDVRELCAYKYDGADKYWDFVEAVNTNCSASNADTCWEAQATTAGLNVSRIKTCQTDEAETLLASEVAIGDKYGVQGSPVLVINDATYSGDRTAEGYKAGICSGFNTAPAACDTTLDATATAANGSCE
ncbi:MAG: hypothetical protein V1898_02325 [Patescibacteria group bacterium]